MTPHFAKALRQTATPQAMAIFALFCIALLVRLPGFGGQPLWTDELWRATLILDPGFWHQYFSAPSVETAITAPVYAALVKFAAAFRVSPAVLRLSSLMPGILAPILVFALVRKAGGSVGLALVGGLVIALNRSFIGYSNELKPYIFEVCVHLACLYALLTVLAADRPKSRTWAIYFLVLILALLSAANAVFLLPSSGLVLLLHAWSKNDRTGMVTCVSGFAVIGLAVSALYFFVWRHGASNGMLTVWADGFAAPGAGYPHFLGTKLAAMWATAFYALPGEAKFTLALLLLTIGSALYTGAAWRAPLRNVLAFYLVLAATMCLVNSLRMWPLGPGRENLFLYAHFIALLFLLLTQLPGARGGAALLLTCLLLSLPVMAMIPSGRVYLSAQAASLRSAGPPPEHADLVLRDFSPSGAPGKSIAAACAQGGSTIVANGYMAEAISYYENYDSKHRQDVGLSKNACVHYVTLAQPVAPALISGGRPVWFVYTFLGPADVTRWQSMAAKDGTIASARTYGDSGYFELIPN